MRISKKLSYTCPSLSNNNEVEINGTPVNDVFVYKIWTARAFEVRYE